MVVVNKGCDDKVVSMDDADKAEGCPPEGVTNGKGHCLLSGGASPVQAVVDAARYPPEPTRQTIMPGIACTPIIANGDLAIFGSLGRPPECVPRSAGGKGLSKCGHIEEPSRKLLGDSRPGVVRGHTATQGNPPVVAQRPPTSDIVEGASAAGDPAEVPSRSPGEFVAFI